ncbi:hypothetical protein HOLleu_39284 [Holothuria leucospilota]|uniref:Uncharacterized protein n=1 Tax=Holothuria leucospilota TaxID=206669 RepID=A0A9Q0YH29_HOLLE|nr:hypothetical protein HOLleu_39284 [Holothuria leucospilota]
MNEEIPVYEVQLESGQGRKRVLYRNLLLQCNELPLDTTPTKVPRKASSSKVPHAHSQPEESEEDHHSSDSNSENDMGYIYRDSHVTQNPPDDHNDSPDRQTRRSQRDRRPKRLFTYDRLGSPTQTQSISAARSPEFSVFKVSQQPPPQHYWGAGDQTNYMVPQGMVGLPYTSAVGQTNSCWIPYVIQEQCKNDEEYHSNQPYHHNVNSYYSSVV